MTTILIVDDEYLIADILRFALEEAGYLTATASNGRKGLEALWLHQPDLVITDFMMPQMNGLELAQAIKASAEFAGIPVLLMSGGHVQEGTAHPQFFHAIFEKPFAVDDVVAMVRSLVPASDRPMSVPEGE